MKQIVTIILFIILAQIMWAQPNYYFSFSSGTFTALSGGTTFTWTGTSDEGYSTATNIGFNFTYDGTVFTQFQVSTNGFLEFGSSLAAATPTDALSGASTLRNVLAPLWDDLDAVATSNITYQLSGTTPNQVLTVEWLNVKWNKTAAAANAQFQIKLYEVDGHFEFVYGTMGSPTAGAASIGINDATASGTWGTFQSINVGGSGAAFHVSMVYPFNAIATAPASNTVLTFTQQTVSAMSGSYTVGSGGNYATPSQAAQALNLNGINGPVTLNVIAGTYDDILHLLNVAGTSATYTITIQPQSGSVTLSPKNGSRTGSGTTTADAAVVLMGTNYTTLDGINIVHASSTNNFEFCLLLTNYSATSGAKYNTIKNCIITGDGTTANSRGIRTSTGGYVSATDTNGSTNWNTFKNIKTTNCGISVYLSGQSAAIKDKGNTITADGSYSGGNTTGYNDIGNINLSVASALRGIYTDAQDVLTIENTEVRSIVNPSTANTSDHSGIMIYTNDAASTVKNCLIHGLTGSGTATQVVYGLWMTAGTTITVQNNKIYDLQGGTTGTAGTVRGILNNVSTASSTVNMYNNFIYDLRNSQSQASNYAVRCIELNSAYNVNMYNNTMYLDAVCGTGANFFATACLYMAASTNTVLDMKNNIMINKSGISTSATSKAIAFAKTTATVTGQITTTSNCNLVYAGAADTKHLLFWDATTARQTLADYQTAMLTSTTGREAHAIAADASSGFVSTSSPYDLHVSTSSWILNGQGIPNAAVTTDYDGNSRSTALSNGPVDIGADEYTPTGSASTSASGTIGDGNTTTYTGPDNKSAVQITWHANGQTLPTSATITYTPGAQATGTTSGSSIYRAYTITSSGGTNGWTADVLLYYNSASELKGYTEASMRINRTWPANGNWDGYLSTTINTTNHTGQATVSYFSTYSFDDGSTPLPVELSTFSASVKNNGIVLNWETATEINTNGFDIERSPVDQNQWQRIGFVKGGGNSNSPRSYTYFDHSISNGTYNYRLKIIDNDGSHNYSKTIEASLIPVSIVLDQNYPNPFNPTTTIGFSLNAETDIALDVYTLNGEKVERIFAGKLNVGYHTFPFNASRLSSGLYLYRLTAGNTVLTKKMILAK